MACAALHHATERLARLLLVTREREATERLDLTQEDLAGMLGLQRTTVNASALTLKTAGAIRYSRGRIQIVDADELGRQACECHRLDRDRAAWPN